jgi:hypothetical protein
MGNSVLRAWVSIIIHIRTTLTLGVSNISNYIRTKTGSLPSRYYIDVMYMNNNTLRYK